MDSLSRRDDRFLRPSRLIGWGIVFAILAYAFLIEPSWVSVEHHRIGSVSDNHRVRIAQLSDLHLRDIGFAEERMFSSLQSLAPDIVLLTGDVVDRPESLAVLDTFLGHIQAPLKLAVLGNWEYWGSVDLVALGKLYDRHGVKLLVNACQKVAVGKSFVRIVGLDDFTAGRPVASKLDPACLGGEGSLILIQHSPGFFESNQLPPGFPTARLNLAGHTHGGQVSLFGYAFWTPPGSGAFNRGWYDSPWGRVYVSRGLGTSVAKIRFASRPEIAVFDIEP